MYSASQNVNAVPRGTGVFYQALPAVGADGKNIMRLIPVQMVNGQFVQTQVGKPKILPKPQEAVPVMVASPPVHIGRNGTLAANTTQQTVRNQISFVNALPDQLGETQRCREHGYSKLPVVTVTSPALPRGQYSQIPPNAQAGAVPASALPMDIQRQISTSSAKSFSSSTLPNVVYVSPMTTLIQSINPASNSAPVPLPQTSNMTLPKAGGSKPHLKLIPKVSRRPNSPMKWVIEEEEDSSRALSLGPLNSSFDTPEIHQAVAERATGNKNCEIITKEARPCLSGYTRSEKEHENVSVMCNGKVFFAARKCNQPSQMKSKDTNSPTAATNTCQLKKTNTLLPQRLLQKDSRIIVPIESDEVIDLCNDDCADDSSHRGASVRMSAVPHVDEDNVIFVSYIPPKSDTALTQNPIPKAHQKESVPTDTRGKGYLMERERLNGTTNSVSTGTSTVHVDLTSDDGDGSSSLNQGKPNQSTSDGTARTVTRGCDVAVAENNVASNKNSQQCTSNQQLRSVSDHSPLDSSGGMCSQIERGTHNNESSTNPRLPSGTSSLALNPCQMTDHELRQMFGIIADVKIYLQRINEAPDGNVQSTSKLSASNIQETTGRLNQKDLNQHFNNPQQNDSISGLFTVKSMQLTEPKLSGGLISTSLHTDIRPLKCSPFKRKSKAPTTGRRKYPSGQSLQKGGLCDLDRDPVISYVEPIDEDLPSADENDTPNSQDSAAHPLTQNCVNPNANTRRMGRARKRTMCPCCIPGTLNPTEKSSATLHDPERWTTEHTGRKGGRISTKARKKDGNNSESTAKNKQSCKNSEGPARNNLSTTSKDSELTGQEQTKRPKEALKEKDATLEMRKHELRQKNSL
ncbi:uncharacterized protein lrif1 [Aulostomus maculatus]